ncbi:MAG TPA: 2-dehydropantoate 2-reductase [Casimicrobiaceae bacterium]|nr:2-dehydropantoate 2-reductase [Casimicrobiaceae bacterium]
MKVCIFGAGAIGGLIGAELARAGVEVALVARGPHLAAMRAQGLRLQIDGEERRVRPRCTDVPAELGVQDYVIIALKAHGISDAVESMRPLLGPQTCVVTASNGLPYWYFYDVDRTPKLMNLETVDPGGRQWDTLGPQRAVGCVVFPAAEVVAPGVVRHEHGRKLPIGEPAGGRSARIETLHRLLIDAGFDAPIRDDIRDEIWLKLWGNLCFNPISALTHSTVDAIASDPQTRAICRAMMAEAQAIGERLGLRLRVDADRRIDGMGALGTHKMSMLQDLERSRPMELEPLVGVVQELGRLLDMPTPTIDVVLALIRQRARSARLQ